VGSQPENPRDAGEAAVVAIRRLLARKAADLIRHDPDAADVALEMGLIDRRWLEQGEGPISSAPPSEVVERFLERAVETRPSRLSALGLGAAQLLSARRSRAAGRAEKLTVLFTDLEGFTAFTDEEGDGAALALLQGHHRVAGPVVRRAGGRIVKHLGDGLLCTFPEAQGGLRAAVELLNTAPAPLRLRAGAHSGEVMVSPYDVIGQAVNIAARVVEIARGGQVLATAETVEAAGPTPGLVAGRSRSRRLKGISDRVVVYEVTTA
jgi:adenylate cyclase